MSSVNRPRPRSSRSSSTRATDCPTPNFIRGAPAPHPAPAPRRMLRYPLPTSPDTDCRGRPGPPRPGPQLSGCAQPEDDPVDCGGPERGSGMVDMSMGDGRVLDGVSSQRRSRLPRGQVESSPLPSTPENMYNNAGRPQYQACPFSGAGRLDAAPDGGVSESRWRLNPSTRSRTDPRRRHPPRCTRRARNPSLLVETRLPTRRIGNELTPAVVACRRRQAHWRTCQKPSFLSTSPSNASPRRNRATFSRNRP